MKILKKIVLKMMNFFKSITGNTKVEVTLKNQVFYPGNVIEGVVRVQNGSDIDFTAVRLKLCAKEKVHIVERRTDAEGRVHKEDFYATNVAYKQLLTLAGTMKSQPNGQRHRMPGGTFYYPFSWQLPTNLPPSFSKLVSDDFAEMVYYVKAYVDIPTGRDAKDKAIFSVLRPMPVSQWIHRAPADVSRNHEVTCCCCIGKGHVQARIFMDRTLISIDRDHLQIFADINNEAGEEPVEGIEFGLHCTIVYRAGHKRETNSYRVGHQFLKSGIPAGGKGLVNGVIQLSRDLLPTITTPNVEIRYKVTIEINIPYASDPCETFDVLLAQSVDDTNFVPALQFNQCPWTMMPAHSQCPEFYYQPPPQPVYQPQMIPMGPPPPNVQMYQPQYTPTPLGLPSPSWQQQATPMYHGQPVPVAQNNSMQWGAGYQQPQVQNYQMGPPPPPMVGGQEQSYGAPPQQQHYQPPQQDDLL